ncbi:MAG TPA: sialate O-acetylesterase, partial [Candidatus Obscuribacterales bacterium]
SGVGVITVTAQVSDGFVDHRGSVADLSALLALPDINPPTTAYVSNYDGAGSGALYQNLGDGWGPVDAGKVQLQQNYAKHEFWITIGQSNMVGIDINTAIGETGEIFPLGTDKPDPNCLEVSWGVEQELYRPAPAGELQIFRHPAQDVRDLPGDVKGTSVSCRLNFMKRRRELFPAIDKIAVLCRAWGNTGFSNGVWGVDDAYYLAVKAEAVAFLAANPHYTFMGILWLQGQQDVVSLMTGPTYQTELIDTMTDLRAALPGGDSAMLLVGTMNPTYLGNTPSAAAIDAVHRSVSSFLDNSATVVHDSLTEMADDMEHYAGNSYRQQGFLFANASAEFSLKQ